MLSKRSKYFKVGLTDDSVSLKATFNTYAEAIESGLREILRGSPRTGLGVISTDHLLATRNRIRSLLALLSCEAVCGDYRPAIPVGVGYELAHSAALIQDDIIDSVLVKGTSPTVVGRYGVGVAILVADWLMFAVFGQFNKYCGWSSRRKLSDLLRIVEKTGKASSLGEFLDMQLGRSGRTSLRSYLKMIRNKTGALIAASTSSGAVVGEATSREVKSLYTFGEFLGMSYQVADDILDVTEEGSLEGEPQFNDLSNGKLNAIVIHALLHGNHRQKEYLRSLIGKVTDSTQRVEASKIFNILGSIDYANELSQELAEKARQTISDLKPSTAKDKLISLSYIATQYHI